MTQKKPDDSANFHTLSDDQAVTLRRIAFGQSEIRTLRQEDIDRLRSLGLVVETSNGLSLTASGREHFNALPRSIFAEKIHPRNSW